MDERIINDEEAMDAIVSVDEKQSLSLIHI